MIDRMYASCNIMPSSIHLFLSYQWKVYPHCCGFELQWGQGTLALFEHLACAKPHLVKERRVSKESRIELNGEKGEEEKRVERKRREEKKMYISLRYS
jgi:hypothetical protein